LHQLGEPTLIDADTRLHAILTVIVGLAAIAFCGYVAARIRSAAAAALAALVAIAVLVLMVTMSESAPLWYGLTFLFVGPLAAVAGGAAFRRPTA
jgi:hypothetical protein